MNLENDILLLEHLLGNWDTAQNCDKELNKLLNEKGTNLRIMQLSQDLEVFNQVTPVKTSSQLRKNILNRISTTTTHKHKLAGFSQRLSWFFKLPIKRINEILQATMNVANPIWDKGMIENASLLHFKGGQGLENADCGLIHLIPGAGINSHFHNGDELMLVLQGYLSCSNHQFYQPGDIVCNPKGSQHSVTVEGNQECIFAVIADQGVTFL